LYLKGYGVIANYVLAERWLRKSAEQGYVSAQYALGALFEEGVGVGRNMDEALIWYKKAADQGDERARVRIQQQKRP
jgi:TPR repeat protein